MVGEEDYEQATLKKSRRPTPVGSTMGEVLAIAFKKQLEKQRTIVENRFEPIAETDEVITPDPAGSGKGWTPPADESVRVAADVEVSPGRRTMTKPTKASGGSSMIGGGANSSTTTTTTRRSGTCTSEAAVAATSSGAEALPPTPGRGG